MIFRQRRHERLAGERKNISCRRCLTYRPPVGRNNVWISQGVSLTQAESKKIGKQYLPKIEKPLEGETKGFM